MVFLTFCAASSQALMFYWVYWDRFENKGLWFGGIFFVLLTGTTVTVSLFVYLRKVISLRSDPIGVPMVFYSSCAVSSQALALYWDRFENKGLGFGGIFALSLTGTTAALSLFVYLRKVISLRSDPVEVAKQFFARAGFQRVEAVSRDVLLLHPRDDPMDLCVLMSDD
jgi:hypothetical protein